VLALTLLCENYSDFLSPKPERVTLEVPATFIPPKVIGLDDELLDQNKIQSLWRNYGL
jgi:hypothetical protein